MDYDDFCRVLEHARANEEHITLGGGEPTIHPRFEDMLGQAVIRSSADGLVFIVTNGKETERALMIARLIREDVISGALSQDEFHDDIDYEVVEAFEALRLPRHETFAYCRPYIRDVTRGYDGTYKEPEIYAGRNKQRMDDLGILPEHDSCLLCPCEDIFVKPDGLIYQCGCSDSPLIGNVVDGYSSPCAVACHRSKEYKKALEYEQKQELCNA